MAVARPDFDPELMAGLAVVGGMFPPTITPGLVGFHAYLLRSQPLDDELVVRGITRTDITIEGYRGVRSRCRSCVHPDPPVARPAVVYAHSGGLMFGDRFSGLDLVLDWVDVLAPSW